MTLIRLASLTGTSLLARSPSSEPGPPWARIGCPPQPVVWQIYRPLDEKIEREEGKLPSCIAALSHR